MSTMTRNQRLVLYNNSSETNVIHLTDGFVDYCNNNFKYLGSHISFDLYDNFQINLRLAAASRQFGQMKNDWNDPLLPTSEGEGNPVQELRDKQTIVGMRSVGTTRCTLSPAECSPSQSHPPASDYPWNK